ncbi:hypothetical protein [Roseateles sp. BYS87W]|uniref:Uncharacterized protein n=1 Tax=Pelomonas baiyunensis TaxID=3299026 RepID=A0ABW7GZV9_9BURK
MNVLLLKWIARALIAGLLASTLWMALRIHPEQAAPHVLVAQAALAADAASAPAAAR